MGLCASKRETVGPAVTAAQAYNGRPLKILCLHGGGMTADGFKWMLTDFAEECGPLVDLVYAQAPHKVGENYIWMGKDEQSSEAMWAPSLAYLNTFVEQHGPFDGVLGYSMGSAVVSSWLAAVPENTFRFALLSSGYVPTTTPSIMKSLALRKPLRTPVLHMMGEQDFIPREMMNDQFEYFDPASRELCVHPGGHHLPRDQEHIEQLVQFILRFTETASSD